jgi:hypothetical protein
MGLGKTLEILGLVSVNPHSTQPFVVAPGESGTAAMQRAVLDLPLAELHAALRRLAA